MTTDHVQTVPVCVSNTCKREREDREILLSMNFRVKAPNLLRVKQCQPNKAIHLSVLMCCLLRPYVTMPTYMPTTKTMLQLPIEQKKNKEMEIKSKVTTSCFPYSWSMQRWLTKWHGTFLYLIKTGVQKHVLHSTKIPSLYGESILSPSKHLTRNSKILSYFLRKKYFVSLQ